jgi:hypothetical protein
MSRKSLITVGLAIAAIAPTAAQAANPLGHPGGPTSVGVVSKTSYLGHPGGPSSVGLVLARSTVSGPGYVAQMPPPIPRDELARIGSGSSFRGVAGGPGSVGLVTTRASSPSSGFAWDDAAIGAGFTAGIGLIAAAAWLASRRRTALVHSNS